MSPRLLRAVKIVVLVVLYTVVVALDRVFGRRVALAALVIGILVACLAAWSGCGRTRVATYNIREMGLATDMDHLVRVASSVEADLFALQEVQHEPTLDALRARLSTGSDLAPSLLDHVVATPGLVAPRSARVHGFCQELACRRVDRAPQEYERVSDHCPVSFALGF